MKLAERPLKAEDEKIVRDFLQDKLEANTPGVAYVLTDNHGKAVVEGLFNSDEFYISKARLRAVVATGFQKSTAEFNVSEEDNKILDGMYSPGGVPIIADGVLYGGVGISGHPPTGKFTPYSQYFDNGELAFLLAEELIRKVIPERQ